LQKIFANNPHLFVQDFQGVVSEDGQLYVIDPQSVDLHENSKRNSNILGALQEFEQTILKRHKRIRTLESGVNALSFGKTNFPCSSSLCVWDLQGLVAEDGQLYIIDPQNVEMDADSKHNSIQIRCFTGI
jgi:hypothetical protein